MAKKRAVVGGTERSITEREGGLGLWASAWSRQCLWRWAGCSPRGLLAAPGTCLLGEGGLRTPTWGTPAAKLLVSAPHGIFVHNRLSRPWLRSESPGEAGSVGRARIREISVHTGLPVGQPQPLSFVLSQDAFKIWHTHTWSTTSSLRNTCNFLYLLAAWLVESLLPDQGLNLGPGQHGIPYNYSQFWKSTSF